MIVKKMIVVVWIVILLDNALVPKVMTALEMIVVLRILFVLKIMLVA